MEGPTPHQPSPFLGRLVPGSSTSSSLVMSPGKSISSGSKAPISNSSLMGWPVVNISIFSVSKLISSLVMIVVLWSCGSGSNPDQSARRADEEEEEEEGLVVL